MAWPIRKGWCCMTLILNLNVVVKTSFVFDLSLMITASFALYYHWKRKKRTKDKTAKCGKPTKDKNRTM